MEITFLFAFVLFIALSEARYKPRLEVYEIHSTDDDKLQINDLSASDERTDFIISKLLNIKKEKDERPRIDRAKNQKMLNVVDGLLNKLKTSKGSAKDNQPNLYVVGGNLIHDDDLEHKFIDDNISVPININLKDIIYEILGQQPHRYKRPILRIQDVEDRTAPPRHRYVYDTDSY